LGLFDYYILKDKKYYCKTCGEELDEWQGKDAENSLFIWEEGKKHPVRQEVDNEIKISRNEFEKFSLRSEFQIYSFCSKGHENILNCVKSKNENWQKKKL
jgi:predicted ATP-dependent serine protease